MDRVVQKGNKYGEGICRGLSVSWERLAIADLERRQATPTPSETDMTVADLGTSSELYCPTLDGVEQ